MTAPADRHCRSPAAHSHADPRRPRPLTAQARENREERPSAGGLVQRLLRAPFGLVMACLNRDYQ